MSTSTTSTASLSERLVALAQEAAEKTAMQSPEKARDYAETARALMQAGALAYQREQTLAQQRPSLSESEAEALRDYREVLASLEQQFRNAGTPTSLRVADRIKDVLDQHKAPPEQPSS